MKSRGGGRGTIRGIRFVLWVLDLQEPLTWHAVCAHFHCTRETAKRWIRAYLIATREGV